MENITMPLRHDFSDDELDEMRDNLVELIGEQTTQKLEKKEVVKSYNDKLKDIESRVKVIAQHISDRYTDRDIACTVEYNSPERDVKTITRLDTNEQWMEPMTESDWNLFTQPVEKQEEE